MKFPKLIFITFFLFTLLIDASAQSFSSKFMTAINQELSDSQIRQIQKANNYISSGDVFMQEVKSIEIDIFSERENEKNASDRRSKKESEKKVISLEDEGRVKLINATKTSEKGYDIFYDVYNEKLSQLMSSSSDNTKKLDAKKSIYDAKSKFSDAKNIIDKLTDRDAYELLSKQVKMAIQLKQEGVFLLVNAICEYIDCNKKEVVENLDEKEDSDSNSDSNSNTNNGNSYSNNNFNNNSNNNSNSSSQNYNKSYIYFTVQILAVSKVLPSVSVDKFYKGNKNVTISYHQGLWKYLVGRFDNYNDALLFQEGIGGDSFVVALKDGQRIDIVQAINETQQ